MIPPDKEWQECRNTIGRFDTNLVDFRKYSFTLVTALITASGFLGQQGVSTSTKAAVSATIMVLIAVLSTIDRYYVMLQSGAVERALDMEGPEIDPNMMKNQLTQVISVRAHDSRSVRIVPLFYIFLVVATSVLAFGVLGRFSNAIVWSYFVVSVAFIYGYYSFTERRSGTGSWRSGRFASSSSK